MITEPKYAIKRGRKYLQGVEINENYCGTSTAPTMSTRHTHTDYNTIWGDEMKTFEKLTATNYIRTLFEEYRWGDKKPIDIKIIPVY